MDGKLVALARAREAAILTNDFNLNRVADLQSIRVLNINSLANALKPALLPGDTLRIKVITEGKEPGQGVGYLDDGTMVVVEGGAKLVGRELDVAGDARPPDGHGPDGLRAGPSGVSAGEAASGGTSSVPIEAVVVAAGSSSRMGGLDKLEAELDGRSVLRWSVEALAVGGRRADRGRHLAGRVAEIAAAAWLPDRSSPWSPGGARRQESVAAGVAALAGAATGEGSAGVDARGKPTRTPAGSPRSRSRDPGPRRGPAAGQPGADPGRGRGRSRSHGAAIPVLPVTETLKRLDGDRVGATVDRTRRGRGPDSAGCSRSACSERAYADLPSGRSRNLDRRGLAAGGL